MRVRPAFHVVPTRLRSLACVRLQTMVQSLVEELKSVENSVVRLQVETRCMERVYVKRVREVSS